MHTHTMHTHTHTHTHTQFPVYATQLSFTMAKNFLPNPVCIHSGPTKQCGYIIRVWSDGACMWHVLIAVLWFYG